MARKAPKTPVAIWLMGAAAVLVATCAWVTWPADIPQNLAAEVSGILGGAAIIWVALESRQARAWRRSRVFERRVFHTAASDAGTRIALLAPDLSTRGISSGGAAGVAALRKLAESVGRNETLAGPEIWRERAGSLLQALAAVEASLPALASGAENHTEPDRLVDGLVAVYDRAAKMRSAIVGSTMRDSQVECRSTAVAFLESVAGVWETVLEEES